jgi:ornithine--oxo-acid transaminase
MRVGLAVLDVLEDERLGEKAAQKGEYLRRRLREELSGYEMVADIRGFGLLNGIEFRAPRGIALRLSFEAFRRVHPAMFGQVLVMRLFRDEQILTQICGNHFMVLKASPPLVASAEHLDKFVASLASIVDLMHNGTSFWADALGMARRVTGV